jgi:hypothetical protein
MAGDKLSDKEIKDRIKKAYDLRYNEKYTQEKYVKWAKENYGDKSEQQYCQYFTKSRKYHEEVWKDLLEQQLKPATLELIRLMADEDPKVRQRAIDQIFKYTGNDIQKIQAEVSGDVKITFGDE